MNSKILVKFAASIGIAVFFLWLTINHMVTDAETTVEGDFWGALLASIKAVPIGTLALYALIFLGVHLARLVRWQYLVMPLGETDRRKIFRICAVGFSAIVLLPLRLGEMVRPVMLSRESSITMSAALATAVVERVIDGLVITGLLFVSLAVFGGLDSSPVVAGAGYLSASIFSGATVVLFLAAAKHDWTVRLLRATLGRVSAKFCDAIIGLVDSFLDGVKVLRREHVLLKFLLLTALYWGLNAVGIAILARGFGFDVSVWQAFAVLAILVIGIMIPAGPGFFGNFQFFLAQGLLLFFSPELVAQAGLAFGLTLNTMQFVLQVGFGVPFYLASQAGLRKLAKAGQKASADA